MERTILHCDLNGFFASVELLTLPHLRHLPVAVCGDPASRHGIVLAKNEQAKAFGIKTAETIWQARKKCPDLILLPSHHDRYQEFSRKVNTIYEQYTDLVDRFGIDESFLDVTPYLKMYGTTAKELAQRIIQDVRETVGTICTCGIGTNLYLAKIALDIIAKKATDSIGILDEQSYREQLWDHQPITDFWRISHGTAKRLRDHGMTTLRHVAMMKEDYLYKWFGIDAELLIDHAWGREPTTIADIKAYRSKGKSLSSGQVLMRDYRYDEGLVIVKEMMDQLCLDMVSKKLATESVSLYVGYSHTQCIGGAKGTAKLACETNADSIIIPAIATLYKRIVNPAYAIRRICLCCNSVVEDRGVYQLNMFDDISAQLRSRAIQETMLGIKAKYGKNAILKGVNYDPAATGRERNLQIGGHKSNG